MRKFIFTWRHICLLMFFVFLSSCQNNLDDPHEDKPNRTASMKISVDDAKKAAINFLNQKTSDSSSKGLPIFTESNIDNVQTIENDNEIPIMYAINLKENQGFVIMSASRVERPILAYNNEGHFDFENIEEFGGVADWAVTRYLTINALIEKGEAPNEQITQQWAAVNPSIDLGFVDHNGNPIPWTPPSITDQWDETKSWGPYLTTKWTQRLTATPGSSLIGYNNFVRFNNCTSGIAPSGCVATAMGQIMRYHKWPNIYNIANMPASINSGNYTSADAVNISYLMQNIGSKVAMTYSCSGSGAHSDNARNAFVSQYQYYTTPLAALNFTPLMNNLKIAKPVYLDGYRTREIKTKPKKVGIFGWTIGHTTYSYSNGHAWVADGFESIKRTTVYSNGYSNSAVIAEHIHMNWGWGGSYNGWYDYQSWDDANTGQNFPAVDYIYNQHMIYNITPN
ncbi:C10 family peptidase [Chryseobacterium indologenes]|uniref:C10 family peptidase n=1 Tax=Chryseobacterium indologenes TaxID=253 RepID=UPI00301B1D77